MVMLLSARQRRERPEGKACWGGTCAQRKVFAGEEKLTKPYTRKLPAWIRWDESTPSYALIEERAALLRWMFEMADDGLGQHSIAAHLNETKVDTWGAGGWKAKYWHRSYIRKLLTNKAAIGIFVPHRVEKVEGKRTKKRTPQEPIHTASPQLWTASYSSA